MKCELLQFFFFSADVAGSATPHFLIDMVEVVKRKVELKWVTVPYDTVAKSLQDKYHRLTSNGYRTGTLTYLLKTVSVTLFKSVALKRTHMNSKSCSVKHIIVTPANSANFFGHIFITHIWHMVLPVIWCGLQLSNPSRLLCCATE